MIEIEPEGGNVRLKVNGREGVKDFIKAEFGDYIPQNIYWENKLLIIKKADEL